LLARPNLKTSLAVLAQLRDVGFTGEVVATAKFEDEAEKLRAGPVPRLCSIFTPKQVRASRPMFSESIPQQAE
tara:strand:+ start:158 stop:376 length:219 start_codon:yes stop_codon:yes gene_type:complete